MIMKNKKQNLLLAISLLSGIAVSAQTTIARPWLEGFQANGGIPAGLVTTGTREAGEDPISVAYLLPTPSALIIYTILESLTQGLQV